MGVVKINTDFILENNLQMKTIENKLKDIQQNINGIIMQMDNRILNRNNIRYRIQNTNAQLFSTTQKIDQIKGATDYAAQSYYNTERTVVKWAESISNVNGNKSVSTSSKSESEKPTSSNSSKVKHFVWNYKDTWKIISNVGIVGSTIAVIGSYITGGKTVKDNLITIQNITKLLEKIAKSSSASFDWKQLFSLNAIDINGHKSWSDFFKVELDKYDFGNATKVSGKIAVAAKWAASILTVLTTFYDNFTDTTENNSTARKISESIGESIVKVGEGFAVSAGIAALCAAGEVAVPAVVVGAASVAVIWAVDKLFEMFTNKNASEFISDSILDLLGNVIIPET